MRLHTLTIEGFRRIKNATILFGDATFLIGPNNAGKSSVLYALETLLSAKKRLDVTDYYSEYDADTGETKVVSKSVVLTAEFRNLPEEATTWRGFRGRVFKYEPHDENDTGLSITYRKTFPLNEDVVIEILSKKRQLKPQFEGCKTPQDFIDAGADPGVIGELFEDLGRTIRQAEKSNLQEIDDIWEISDELEWFKNPGGIPGNVLSRLPSVLIIPAETASAAVSDTRKGALASVLEQLFQDVRNSSENYKLAQKYLDELAKELDPNDSESEFGRMMAELNRVLTAIFPESRIHTSVDLSDPDRSLTPMFSVEMSSNVRTPVDYQGTGMVRSAVFGLLRFRQRWLAERAGQEHRSVIIGFEEPEIYLHPSAANQMRDTIYSLSTGTSQIVATTHSPFLIDLSRSPRQVLNRFQVSSDSTEVIAFSVTDKFKQLQADEKDYVKMLLKMDDHMARVFFTKKVIVVEGDSEEIAIRQSLAKLPEHMRTAIKSEYEVVRARGKAAIIGLAKYLRALGIDFHVIHDADGGNPRAAALNKPILNAVGDPSRITVLRECLEDVLGYDEPSKDKPYAAYAHTELWENTLEDASDAWKNVLVRIFNLERYLESVEGLVAAAIDDGDPMERRM